MKTFRIWLLVLLAVLLPVRGAVGAAMLCPGGGAGSHAAGSMAGMAGMASDHHAMHEHAGHRQTAPPDAAGHHGGIDKCNLCCDLCSMTPMPDALPAVPVPLGASSASFPDLFVPAPSFVSDGQERPPRTV